MTVKITEMLCCTVKVKFPLESVCVLISEGTMTDVVKATGWFILAETVTLEMALPEGSIIFPKIEHVAIT